MSNIAIHRSRPRIRPQPAPRLAKSDRTRAAILDAALEFLWDHPFRNMTVSRLMDRTDVGRSAFYQYFSDLHELMEHLLHDLQDDIMAGAQPWFAGTGEVTGLLRRSLEALVRVGYEKGPILKAVAAAAPNDERLDRAWSGLLHHFDAVVTARIEADQRQGLIPKMDALAVARAFTQMDAYSLIEAFGEHPREAPEPLLNAIERIWISTLYGWNQDPSAAPLVRNADELTLAAD